jgi:hypothetical protein
MSLSGSALTQSWIRTDFLDKVTYMKNGRAGREQMACHLHPSCFNCGLSRFLHMVGLRGNAAIPLVPTPNPSPTPRFNDRRISRLHRLRWLSNQNAGGSLYGSKETIFKVSSFIRLQYKGRPQSLVLAPDSSVCLLE